MAVNIFNKKLAMLYKDCASVSALLNKNDASQSIKRQSLKSADKLICFLASKPSQQVVFKSENDADAIAAILARRYQTLLRVPEGPNYTHPFDIGFTINIVGTSETKAKIALMNQLVINKAIGTIGFDNATCLIINQSSTEVSIIFLTKRNFTGVADKLFKNALITSKVEQEGVERFIAEAFFLLPISVNFNFNYVINQAMKQEVKANHVCAIDNTLNAIGETFVSLSSFLHIDDAIKSSFRDAILPATTKARYTFEQ